MYYPHKKSLKSHKKVDDLVESALFIKICAI